MDEHAYGARTYVCVRVRRSELNVLRLGAIVAIKRDTVLFFPETGGKGENSCSSRSFPTKFSDRFDKIYLYLYALRMLLARSKRFSRDIRNSCHIRVEQSAYPFIHLCSCTFHESRIVGNHRSVKVQRRKGLVSKPFETSVSFHGLIERWKSFRSLSRTRIRRLTINGQATASPRKDTYRVLPFYFTLSAIGHWSDGKKRRIHFVEL